MDQIAKSIIFTSDISNAAMMFLTLGGKRIDAQKALELADGPLGKANATLILAQTELAIGDVSPIWHLSPINCFIDPRL